MSSFSRTAMIGLTLLALASSATPQQVKGNKYALLVGVKDYDHSSLAPLKYTENDVNEFAKVLLGKEAGFAEVVALTTTGGVKNASLKPTAANIRAQLKKLSDKVKRHDMLVVGLAGHGLQFTVVDPKTKKDRYESFFCPTDARPQSGRSFEELKKTMLPLGELFKELDESGAGVRLMLVDACRNDVTDSSRSVDSDFLLKPAKGTAVLFSCKSGERAFESTKLKHGVFFYHVIQAFKGDDAKDRRGELSWKSLTDYVVNAVADKVPELIGGGARQTPHEMLNIEGKSPVLVSLGKARSADQDEEAKRLFREADALFQGLEATFDDKRALRLFRMAAEKGHPVADAMVGLMIYGGWGIEQDKHQGERIIAAKRAAIETAANKGDAIAERLLGLMYRNGAGVKLDYKDALKWFQKAAEKGDQFAMEQLGIMYVNGQGVERNPQEGFRWIKRAAEKGAVQPMWNLSNMYQFGTGVAKDDKEVVNWTRKAAAKEFPPAMLDMGSRYMTGKGVDKNEKEAVAWWRKAADLGDASAMFNLSRVYHEGVGVQKDAKQSSRWLLKAAQNGDVYAMAMVADRYRDGKGVPQDNKEAAAWYRKAAEKGHSNSMDSLAVMLMYGNGVRKDEKEAIAWLRKAVALGDNQAMYILGVLHEDGTGVEKNQAEALKWYRKAAAAGNANAKARLLKLK